MDKEEICARLEGIAEYNRDEALWFLMSLYDDGDYQTLRTALLETERLIKQIANSNENELNGFCLKLDSEKQDSVEALLFVRKDVLNMMMRPTENEVRRMERQNESLLQLTKRMEKHANLLGMVLDDTTHKTDSFLFDYEIVGGMIYEYNPEIGILQMPEDEFYGSDFSYIHNLIRAIDNGESIVEFSSAAWPLDNGISWAEDFLNNEAFEHICICRAVNAICTGKTYSITDFLRMNNFVTRLRIEYMKDWDARRERLISQDSQEHNK